MIVQLGPEEFIDTDDLNIPTLEEILETVRVKHDEIVADQQAAKVRYREDGISKSADWHHRVEMARRKTGHAKMQLMQEIARRKKAERMQENFQSQLPKHFMAVAKSYLSDATYTQILEVATRRYQDTQQGVREGVNYVFEVGE